MKHLALVALSLSITLTAACSNKSEDKAAPAASSGGGGGEAKPAAKPAEAGGDVDLSPGGDAWKGLALKAPSNAQVTENGDGGVFVSNQIDFSVELKPGKPDMNNIKEGLKFGVETTKGTITYSIDKPDELAYTTETPAGDGKIKGYGFAHPVTVDGKPYTCTTTTDSEKQAASARAACDSLHKK